MASEWLRTNEATIALKTSRKTMTRRIKDGHFVLGDHMPKLGLLYETFKLFCADFGYSKVINRRTLLTRIKQALPNLHTQRRSVPCTNSTKKVNPQLFGFRIRPEVDCARWEKRNYLEGNWAALSMHNAEAPKPEQVFEHQRLSN